MLTVNLIGNLGADAQIKESNGHKFLSFNVAHTEKYVQNGQPISRTQWVSVAMNHYSDKLLPYLVRGAKIYVYGKLNTNIWYDKNRVANVSLNIMADNVELCGIKSEATPQQATPQAQQQPTSAKAETNVERVSDANLPF